MSKTFEELSQEQQQFIRYALGGHNILVDACIGSGKTTAIQTLCDLMQGKRILYLTYNKLLKLDAKDRIRNGYVNVTNYHGFCYSELLRAGQHPGITELIQVYNRVKPVCTKYDVLILDEYQDIEQEIADMLLHIKQCCPGIQLIAVGDMAQKIYDKTRLDVQPFISEFLGTYIPMEFTHCFRIGPEHAAMLGRIWEKTIIGVNQDFQISFCFEHQIRNLVSGLKPSQLLVLGSKSGKAQELQNYLEDKHQDIFNKRTLWSKIKDTDGATNPTPDCAIFTTYDGCKGMEREVCVVYDWSSYYWNVRLNKPNTEYEILRNIFCVAASRAKKHLIIAVTDGQLKEDEIRNPDTYQVPYRDMNISDMFDYKFIEDIEAAYRCLDIREVQKPTDIITVPLSDELIDLSPCIGHYQEAMYFKRYNIDDDLEYHLGQPEKSHMRKPYQKYTLDMKLLYLSTLETKQQRYMNQVKSLPITTQNRERIRERLAEHFSEEAVVQKGCFLPFFKKERPLFNAHGIMDVLVDKVVWELKFVSALSHNHVLQLAMYLAGSGYAVGRLFNVRTNEILEVRIPDRGKFLDKVAATVTKGDLASYQASTEDMCIHFIQAQPEAYAEFAASKISDGDGTEQFFASKGCQLPVSGADFLAYVKWR